MGKNKREKKKTCTAVINDAYHEVHVLNLGNIPKVRYVRNGRLVTGTIDVTACLDSGDSYRLRGTVVNGLFSDVARFYVNGTNAREGTINYELGTGTIDVNDWHYIGQVLKFQRNGYGQCKYVTSGISYSGNWRDDRKNGMGKLSVPDGRFYQGTWKNDILTGNVLAITEYGMYNGKWKVDVPDGEGIYNYKDGTRYEGSLTDGIPEGYGRVYYADGSTYAGYWSDGHQHGTGTAKYSSGVTYCGEWAYGKRHGYGKYTFVNKNVYEGDWSEDDITGIGTLYNSVEGYTYRGEWDTFNRTGTGTCKYADGTVYTGEWDGDERHGRGTLTDDNGEIIYAGRWRDDKPAPPRMAPGGGAPSSRLSPDDSWGAATFSL